jgi:hypothetical protein
MPPPTRMTWNEFRKYIKPRQYPQVLVSHAYKQYKHYKEQQEHAYKHYDVLLANVEAVQFVCLDAPYLRNNVPDRDALVWDRCGTCIVLHKGEWRLLFDEDVCTDVTVQDILAC